MSARDELGNPITQQHWEKVLCELELACTKAREVTAYAEKCRELLEGWCNALLVETPSDGLMSGKLCLFYTPGKDHKYGLVVAGNSYDECALNAIMALLEHSRTALSIQSSGKPTITESAGQGPTIGPRLGASPGGPNSEAEDSRAFNGHVAALLGVGNPPGWKLVPVEATTPMLRALGDLRAKGQWQWKNQEAWAAMLAAAPPPGRWRHDLDCAQRGGNECSCGLDAEKSGNSQVNSEGWRCPTCKKAWAGPAHEDGGTCEARP